MAQPGAALPPQSCVELGGAGRVSTHRVWDPGLLPPGGPAPLCPSPLLAAEALSVEASDHCCPPRAPSAG